MHGTSRQNGRSHPQINCRMTVNQNIAMISVTLGRLTFIGHGHTGCFYYQVQFEPLDYCQPCREFGFAVEFHLFDRPDGFLVIQPCDGQLPKSIGPVRIEIVEQECRLVRWFLLNPLFCGNATSAFSRERKGRFHQHHTFALIILATDRRDASMGLLNPLAMGSSSDTMNQPDSESLG